MQPSAVKNQLSSAEVVSDQLASSAKPDLLLSPSSGSLEMSDTDQQNELYMDPLSAELTEEEVVYWQDPEKAYLDIQSPARPFGLDVVDAVQMGGSDADSQDFAENYLPGILDFIENNILDGNIAVATAPDTEAPYLTLQDPADLRVYFVADNGEYHNSIGMFFGGEAGGQYDPSLLFPDASSMYSAGQNMDGEWATSEEYPLLPGDFIDIGSVEAGSYLDLFIIPEGANEGASDAYVTDKTLNEDQTSHMKILGVAGDSLLVIGFEDMKNGGDQDYNDVVIAVDVGQQNIDTIAAELGM
ncbi:MAG: DUF4114 domain-containing protein [Pontiellaceae bacterium]|nr:DUF4114 domain-containing protein [Pontiellaceae bacterium]